MLFSQRYFVIGLRLSVGVYTPEVLVQIKNSDTGKLITIMIEEHHHISFSKT